MFLAVLSMLAQSTISATRPTFFILVVVTLLLGGGIAWLIAAVLGFARARAFGPSARWFSYAAVCMIIYHLHFLLFGIVTYLSATQSGGDTGNAMEIGAFFNLFEVLAAFCAIMGFIRLTSPR
jgi:hypothetical protein